MVDPTRGSGGGTPPRKDTMRIGVKRKQHNSRGCLVCGLENASGLAASFHELDNGDLLALFTPRREHQGYPGLTHGGITTAVLDETIGRAVMISHPEDIWGVTVELSVRFRRPVPIGVEIRVLGRLTKDTRRFFEGTGEVLLPDGQIAVEATGRYMRLPLERITDAAFREEEWRVVPSPSDPAEVELPERRAAGLAGTTEATT
jgi:acyl-coenzyme A thioesterase PaaI-like protein